MRLVFFLRSRLMRRKSSCANPGFVIVAIFLLSGLPNGAFGDDLPITFYEHILPILEGHCLECHRPNAMAPMSLIEYEEVRPWAKAIKREVVARRMPPFHADGPIGLWRDDPRLSEVQIEMISSWVDSGAPRGSVVHAREALAPKATKWPLGEPDIIIPFRPYTTPGDGEDHHVYLLTEYTFDRETWIESIQWSNSNRKALHHASLSILYTTPQDVRGYHGQSRDLNTLRVNRERSTPLPMSLYLPGSKPYRFPAQRALRISANTSLVSIAHYAPTDTPQMDEVVLGFRLANGTYRELEHDTRKLKSSLQVTKNSKREIREMLNIPPRVENYTFKAERLVMEDLLMWGAVAHMHLRGKSYSVTAHFPDETSRSLIRVSNYSFDWQRFYWYVEPAILPKGTRLEYEWVWDNSASNAVNPDPDAWVRYGRRSNDEMAGGGIMVTPLNEHEDSIVLSQGMRR